MSTTDTLKKAWAKSTEPGLVAFFATTGQETERVYSLKPGACTGRQQKRLMFNSGLSVFFFITELLLQLRQTEKCSMSLYPPPILLLKHSTGRRRRRCLSCCT